MPTCSSCGAPTVRLSRTMLGKVFSRASFRCTSCERKANLRPGWMGALQRSVQCPKCGTKDLSRIRSRDYIDKMSGNLLRRLLWLLGYPLYHCIYCRYQFRDWRKRESDDIAAS